ncbi:helix-turn-helix transcriptional regulator [Thiothrix unzii]|jgi:transcriptional regulator with XRE-family HTH domain|uniref:helix-turn-helix domain-containing protein n=1 Tax=Thiothrix unzii TaxID=111769 RepID=UPI002A371BA1|nr:helix-turn-helix transcriptional regulator [Thiothrix unzii]MDX9987363.1 helix-turn-helix transcriptional regulator [Thiothrix unzii]
MNEKKYFHIGQRLEEERVRLGLNRSGMASLGKVANSAYGNYEKGDRAPTGEFLAAVATGGVDVQYVLTGNRSESVDGLSCEELKLLANFRDSGKQKNIIQSVAVAIANFEKGKG